MIWSTRRRQALNRVTGYPPPAFFVWWFIYEAYAPDVFTAGAFMAAGGALVSVFVAIGMSIWRAREAKKVTTFGSARWASEGEAKAAGLLGQDGVVLGRLGQHYLRHDGPEHVLCFAPTRSGKGVGLVVPVAAARPRRAGDLAARLQRAPAPFQARLDDT